MKNPTTKLLLLGIVLIVGFFVSTEVKAASVLDQLVIDNTADNSTEGGTYTTSDNQPWLTSTAPIEEAIIFVDSWEVGSCVGCQFYVSLKYLVSGSTVLVESSNRVDAGISGSVSFTFPSNTQPSNLLVGYQVGRAFGDFGGTWFASLPIRGETNCTGCKLFGSNGASTFSPYIRLFDNAATSTVSFKNPPFVPFMRTVDFTTWQVCYSLVPTDLPQHFFFRIDYGLTTVGEFSDPSDELTRPGTSAAACTDIGKSHDLEPGAWGARVGLYDINGVTLPIQSSILLFDVTGGTQQTLPINQIIPTEELPTTCGTTNLKIAGVDFGQGICQLFTFLFIPTNGFGERMALTAVVFQSKAPFSFFYDMVNLIQSQSTTDAGNTPTLTFSVPGLGSMPFFQSSTFSSYAGSGNIALFKTIVSAFLYVGLATTIYFTVKNLV